MAKRKYYAVRSGRKRGVFTTWEECQKQTDSYPGAVFKSFSTEEEARAYLGTALKEEAVETAEPETEPAAEKNPQEEHSLEKLPAVYAFTDGSFCSETGVYGYGGFLHTAEEEIPVRGHGSLPELAESRNVAGETLGAIAAMEKAVELGIKEMTLFYDYQGIEMWATGAWKAGKPVSRKYVQEYKKLASRIKVHFFHVRAHTGIPGNELADEMAKEEAGISG